jgi:integrase
VRPGGRISLRRAELEQFAAGNDLSQPKQKDLFKRFFMFLSLFLRLSGLSPISNQRRRVIAAVGPRTPHADRDRALLLFLYNAGARVSEALAVPPENSDLSASTGPTLW